MAVFNAVSAYPMGDWFSRIRRPSRSMPQYAHASMTIVHKTTQTAINKARDIALVGPLATIKISKLQRSNAFLIRSEDVRGIRHVNCAGRSNPVTESLGRASALRVDSLKSRITTKNRHGATSSAEPKKAVSVSPAHDTSPVQTTAEFLGCFLSALRLVTRSKECDCRTYAVVVLRVP